MTRHIIAIGHRPPRRELRIVSAAGYELSVFDDEDVGEMVRAAEAVRLEVEACPWLGEVDIEEMEDL